MDFGVSRGVIQAVSESTNARVLEPGDKRVMLGLAIAEGLAMIVPGGQAILADVRKLIESATENVSFTFPFPGGTMIAMSRAAVADPISFFATGMHELVHARQIAKVGGFQAGVDHLGSAELRAEREAEASGVGLFCRFVVTGKKPNPDDASILWSDIYHLMSPDKQFARGVVESVLKSVETAAVPPFSVVPTALSWLRKNAPQAIAVADYR